MPTHYRYYARNENNVKLYYHAKLLLAFVLGALTILAYAPFHLWPIAVITMTLLCFCIQTSNPKPAMLIGLLFGLGYFGCGASWVFISIHRFGGANLIISMLLTALLIFCMSIYYAIATYIMRRWLHRNTLTNCLCSFPAMWVTAEWIRGHAFTGFPWLMLGYSQISTPLQGYASIIGVYGISLLLCLSAGCLTCFLYRLPKRQHLAAILLLIGIWGLGFVLSRIDWTTSSGPKMNISIVQGNVPQSDKWNANLAENIANHYVELTQPYWGNRLIIWPEAAIPLLESNARPLLNQLQNKAIQSNSGLLLGIPIQDTQHSDVFNSALLLGNNQGQYLKRHLVPFGEYFPYRTTFSWIYNQLSIPLSNLSSGPDEQQSLMFQQQLIAPYICYEIGFPAEVADHLNKANVIAVLSDDSWFGDSLAAPQHLQMAQMRALENGRPVVFASNTGPSAFINARGKITGLASKDKANVISQGVTPKNGSTLYTIVTDHLLYVLLIVLTCITILVPQKKSNLHKYQRVEYTVNPFRLQGIVKKWWINLRK